MTQFLRRYLALFTLFLVAIAVATNSYAVLQARSAQRSTCHRVEALKTVIHREVEASANLLGKKGTAGYTYYREHPDELANARYQLRVELRAFGVHSCT